MKGQLLSIRHTAPEQNNKALVVVNSIAYNTTYAVDFLRDGEELSQVKVYKASKLSVTPADWEVTDEVRRRL